MDNDLDDLTRADLIAWFLLTLTFGNLRVEANEMISNALRAPGADFHHVCEQVLKLHDMTSANFDAQIEKILADAKEGKHPDMHYLDGVLQFDGASIDLAAISTEGIVEMIDHNMKFDLARRLSTRTLCSRVCAPGGAAKVFALLKQWEAAESEASQVSTEAIKAIAAGRPAGSLN